MWISCSRNRGDPGSRAIAAARVVVSGSWVVSTFVILFRIRKSRNTENTVYVHKYL